MGREGADVRAPAGSEGIFKGGGGGGGLGGDFQRGRGAEGMARGGDGQAAEPTAGRAKHTSSARWAAGVHVGARTFFAFPLGRPPCSGGH